MEDRVFLSGLAGRGLHEFEGLWVTGLAGCSGLWITVSRFRQNHHWNHRIWFQPPIMEDRASGLVRSLSSPIGPSPDLSVSASLPISSLSDLSLSTPRSHSLVSPCVSREKEERRKKKKKKEVKRSKKEEEWCGPIID